MPGRRELKHSHLPVRQAGVGLIEVAIAILVLSIGALGLAGLQVTAKRAGFDAVQRSEATALAADLLERMRANRQALSAYRSAGVGAAAGTGLPEPGNDCRQVDCSPAELAQWDMWQWQQSLNGAATLGPTAERVGGLVDPLGCVTVAGRRTTVEITWRGDRSSPGATADVSCGAGADGPDDAGRQVLRLDSWIGEGAGE